MFSIFDFTLILLLKLVTWSLTLSIGIVWLTPTTYNLLLIKLTNTMNFYTEYLIDNLTSAQREKFLNTWSPGKFADGYWFVYTKSTSRWIPNM